MSAKREKIGRVRNRKGYIFYYIHAVIRKEIFNNKLNEEIYLEHIYGWIDELHNDFEIAHKELEERCSNEGTNIGDAVEYYQKRYYEKCKYQGLRKLITNKILVQENDGKWGPNTMNIRTKAPYYSIYKDIERASSYLKDMLMATYSNENSLEILVNNVEEQILSKFSDENFTKELLVYEEGDFKAVYNDFSNLAEYISNTFKRINVYEKLSFWVIFASTYPGLPNMSKIASIPHTARNNIFLTTKGDIEQGKNKISLSDRCLDAKKITLVNFAGSSFIANDLISSNYQCENENWGNFLWNLQHTTDNKLDIVLVDPDSYAAQDAINYKMRPQNLKVPLEKIIPTNIITLKQGIRFLPYDNLRLFFTDVSLPCGYFMNEFDDETRDNIKVDIYLPSFSDYIETDNGDKILKDNNQSDSNQRLSFTVWRKENTELFQLIKNNIINIINHSKRIDIKNINEEDYI